MAGLWFRVLVSGLVFIVASVLMWQLAILSSVTDTSSGSSSLRNGPPSPTLSVSPDPTEPSDVTPWPLEEEGEGKKTTTRGGVAPQSCATLGPRFELFIEEYIQTHNNNKRRQPSTTPRLIYNCESNKKGHFCGGMGDRFRGMITTFFLALVSNRTFKLYHPVPVPLQDYLQPHMYDWTTSYDEIENIPVDKSLMRLQRHRAFAAKLASNLNTKTDLRVQSNSFSVDPYVHGNRALHARSVAMGIGPNCNLTCYFNCLYDVLFTPSEELRSEISRVSNGHKPYVAMQVRVGGDWATGMRIREAYRTHPRALPHYWSVVKELLALPAYKGCHLFVSSDSARFIAEAKRTFGDIVFSVEGGFNHTDTQNLNEVRPEKYKAIGERARRRDYLSTLLNHYLLGAGEHMVMAQSGFGDTAFWRTRKSATALFMDMNDYRTIWMHHLSYPSKAASVTATKNRIFDSRGAPQPYYTP
eukprot:PhM_4_TR15092/c0_g1_i1/m.71805